RMKFFQRLAQPLPEPWVEHPRVEGRFVRTGLVNVPPAQFPILELGQRQEILDQVRAAFGPFAETDSCKLGQRSNRCAQPALDRLDACNECRADRTEAGKQNAELA